MSKEKMNPYSVEFKERAVKLALESDQTIAQTAVCFRQARLTSHFESVKSNA
jgi:transposase-like protein